jgi:hypothetical protein
MMTDEPVVVEWSGWNDSLELTWKKTCSRCGQVKESSEFPADCTTPDGLSYWCKMCKYAATRAWYYRVGKEQRRKLAEFRLHIRARLQARGIDLSE